MTAITKQILVSHFTRSAPKFMRCKVPIPKSNSVTATINTLSWHTHLGITLTILTCSYLSLTIQNYFLPSDAIAQTQPFTESRKVNFGLGLPKTASIGGATRLVNREERGGAARGSIRPGNSQPPLFKKRELPLLVLITPEDGARTASPQPTLYWYLYVQRTQASQSEIDNLSSNPSTINTDRTKNNFLVRLSITSEDDAKSVTIFQTNLKMQSGLSSFKLPASVSLKPSKPYRWQIVLQDQKVNASGWIVYTPPEGTLQKSLMRTLTVLDRAKIYAQSGYWFDAIDGYMRWLNFKPDDLKTRNAMNEILKTGFASNRNLDFDAFIGMLNTNATKSTVK
ncbi:MAG: hypothetical protein DCF20_14305 [Pseudanabaena sp.]|nr:MAG: hypothetical protein DCF20_14305 [Pseudanabaena sp.]